MSAAGLAFTVHDGDIKDGPVPCTQAISDETLRLFDRFDHPLVYTPGDNEWTDCWRSSGKPWTGWQPCAAPSSPTAGPGGSTP